MVLQAIKQGDYRIERSAHFVRNGGSEHLVEVVLDLDSLVLDKLCDVLYYDHGRLGILELDLAFFEHDNFFVLQVLLLISLLSFMGAL